MNQDQQPRPWWKDNRLVWALAVLVLTWLLTITILFLFPLTTILSLFHWQSWDWRWLALLGLIFLSAGVLYLTIRHVWNRLFDLTGFRGKTLWDLLGLLIVPLVILGATGVLNYFETERENKRAEALRIAEVNRADALRKADIERADALLEAERERAQTQQQIEDDRVRQNVLQSYIQGMTQLLLDKGLVTSVPDQPIRDIARSSTLTAVRQLDADRKGILLQFLSESNLIEIDPIIHLSGANLTNANLSGANLSNTNLSGANLTNANLSGAKPGNTNLSNTNLSNTILTNADLSDANLFNADLRGAKLRDADLSRADLSDADLTSGDPSDAITSSANLINANLSGAILILADLTFVDLSDAILSDAFLNDAILLRANLPRANLKGADLRDADLSDAFLGGAKGWTHEQLAQAEFLVGATLPYGTVMTEEGWEELKKRYGQ